MSFCPPQAFFDCSFPHQLRPSCHNYETKSVYVYVSIKNFDGVTAQNVKMGKGNILFHLVLPFLDTLVTCFGLWVLVIFGGFFVWIFFPKWTVSVVIVCNEILRNIQLNCALESFSGALVLKGECQTSECFSIKINQN